MDVAGSSPLARGLHYLEDQLDLESRIIPARAGFTRGVVPAAPRQTDHPRSRGVYFARGYFNEWEPGSSPLARGLLCHTSSCRLNMGIIPARAGFTPRKRIAPSERPDHPRSRGVYRMRWPFAVQIRGSSPLARGLRSIISRGREPHRIIPARAGFTISPVNWSKDSPDHPRSRGVYLEEDSGFVTFLGSSPLARGLLRIRERVQMRSRIIPARAGFTGTAMFL